MSGLILILLLLWPTPGEAAKNNLDVQVTVRVKNRDTGRVYTVKSREYASSGDSRRETLLRCVEDIVETPPTKEMQSIERGDLETTKGKK